MRREFRHAVCPPPGEKGLVRGSKQKERAPGCPVRTLCIPPQKGRKSAFAEQLSAMGFAARWATVRRIFCAAPGTGRSGRPESSFGKNAFAARLPAGLSRCIFVFAPLLHGEIIQAENTAVKGFFRAFGRFWLVFPVRGAKTACAFGDTKGCGTAKGCSAARQQKRGEAHAQL